MDQSQESLDEIKRVAAETLQMEANAVGRLADLIDDNFATIIALITDMKGRVVVTGIGKSANIAQKIVATLNSTGTPAIFMHAADAIHGDLGMVQKEDVVVCLSKSGNTPEVKVLVPLVKSLGNQLIAMVGNMESYLANQADHCLDVSVEREACPNNLAPTTSTTAQLAMGDALAVSLMHARGFSSDDFAKFHPGGSLGKKLYVRMGDLLDNGSAPAVTVDTPIDKVIIEITSKRLGATAVMDGNDLAGMITDGDLRRMLQQQEVFNTLTAADIMSTNPKSIDAQALAVEGFQLMEKHSITQLIVTRDGRYSGIVHLHDILKEGIY